MKPPCFAPGRRKLLLEMVAGARWAEDGETCSIGGRDVALDDRQRVNTIRMLTRLPRDIRGLLLQSR